MKSKDLTKLALIGLSSGLFFGCQGSGDSQENGHHNGHAAGNQGSTFTADNLASKLDAAHKEIFNSMDAETQALVVQVANTKCHGQNACKGLNGCKTASNECAGMAACKGQGGCAVSDPNLAVKLVTRHMAEKRAEMNY